MDQAITKLAQDCVSLTLQRVEQLGWLGSDYPYQQFEPVVRQAERLCAEMIAAFLARRSSADLGDIATTDLF